MRRVNRLKTVVASTYCTPVIVRPISAAAQVPGSTPASVTGTPVMAPMASRSVAVQVAKALMKADENSALAASSSHTSGRPSLHVVAERRQQLGRGLHRGDALGVGLDRRIGRGPGEPDAQPTGVGAELVDVGPGRRRGGVGIAGHRAVDRVEHRRGVAHRAGHDEPGHVAAPGLAHLGAERVATRVTA